MDSLSYFFLFILCFHFKCFHMKRNEGEQTSHQGEKKPLGNNNLKELSKTIKFQFIH